MRIAAVNQSECGSEFYATLLSGRASGLRDQYINTGPAEKQEVDH